MKLLAVTAFSAVFGQSSVLFGGGDDYMTEEYGDDGADQDALDLARANKTPGKIPGSRKGGRRKMINGMATKNFWEFEQYGCWCLENKGRGQPQDELDFACFAHSKCWGCARAENGKECDGLQTSYNWRFIKDGSTGVNIEIACLDQDPCKRAICECDRKLALNLRDFEYVYNSQLRDQSLKADQCKTANKGPVLAGRSLALGEKEKKAELDSCCGDEIFRYPFATNGGLRACCGTRTYNTETLECCSQEDSDIRSIGMCPL
ncbi:Oidioi.mRNA.OKI2018_I69.chr2.g4415.t1.cds [Oikopleura dioica]|uniref:Oidioi.mRNA.OKI2018_I69.chr2.g4415.t1.cds n=1 Tax=Oikopleura dioica TaxID=34765 RepID=A0ABN7T0Q0_OIKDI|nr:Oidioi.mRNA.OKI2018_I69.chr2.g4415.t1.cds [Oikopleura dioica]